MSTRDETPTVGTDRNKPVDDALAGALEAARDPDVSPRVAELIREAQQIRLGTLEGDQ